MASLEFFRHTYQDNPIFFDEGPRVSNVKPASTINTSSIDTSPIDGFRQGVELTQIKHFDAGCVKIHAGEPGHIIKKTSYGMSNNVRTAVPFYKDVEYFNPVLYIKAQELDTSLFSSYITFPITTSDNEEIENYLFNGVIEPLTIRARAAFFSIDVPFEAHEIKGALMGGNTDQTWSSDQILAVDRYDFQQQIFYLDMVDMFEGRIPMNGFFRSEKSKLKPFIDARYVRNTISSASYSADMTSALSLMSGSTNNYINIGYRSAAAGWDYNNNMSIGTDSIAFGGRVY